MAQYKAGTLGDFSNSMAAAIEAEMAILMGPLSDSPEEVIARRSLLVAISRGVLRHLRDNQTAIQVSGTVAFNTFSTTPVISVQDLA